MNTASEVGYGNVVKTLAGYEILAHAMLALSAGNPLVGGAISTIANACKGKAVTVKSVERKEKSEKAPALYDLTSLQRNANRVLGYTPFSVSSRGIFYWY